MHNAAHAARDLLNDRRFVWPLQGVGEGCGGGRDFLLEWFGYAPSSAEPEKKVNEEQHASGITREEIENNSFVSFKRPQELKTVYTKDVVAGIFAMMKICKISSEEALNESRKYCFPYMTLRGYELAQMDMFDARRS